MRKNFIVFFYHKIFSNNKNCLSFSIMEFSLDFKYKNYMKMSLSFSLKIYFNNAIIV